MGRFYVLPKDVKADRVYIRGKEAHHILDVMRLKVGDRINTFDGTGREYVGFIERARAKEVVMRIQEIKECRKKESPKITLVQAMPKKDKMDYIVQKCVELGVDTIIPVRTERTIIKLDRQKAQLRRRRWEKIVIEACKQSGRSSVPKIEEIKDFKDALDTVRRYDLAILPSLHSEAKDLKGVIRGGGATSRSTSFSQAERGGGATLAGRREGAHDLQGAKPCRSTSFSQAERGGEISGIIVFIGPEGGFSRDEENSAKEAGCILVSLGPRTLRADTAPVATLAILSYELER